LPNGGAVFDNGLSVVDDVLVVLVEDGTAPDGLRGLDLVTGADRWVVPDDFSSALVTADGTVYLTHGRTAQYVTARTTSSPEPSAGCSKATRGTLPSSRARNYLRPHDSRPHTSSAALQQRDALLDAGL
jgi:hypothetical protein